MKIIKKIYEHLKTKKKYNTLEIKLIGTREDLERKITELNTEKRIHHIRQETWENALKEQEGLIIELKKEIKKLKSEMKKCKEQKEK